MSDDETSSSWAVWLLGFFALLATTAMGAWMNRTIDSLEEARAEIVELQREVDVIKERFATIDGRLTEIQTGISTILRELGKGPNP